MVNLNGKQLDQPGKIGQSGLIIPVSDHMEIIIQSPSPAFFHDGKKAPGTTGIQLLDQCNLILFYFAPAEKPENSRKDLIRIHDRESSK